jgi:hypothetical protein
MSRRIIFCVLAAAATLIATQASADRECFENSCRLPDVVEAPAQAAPSPKAEETATPETGAARAEAPSGALAPIAADPAPRQSPRNSSEARTPARATNTATGTVRAERASAPASAYDVSQSPAPAAPVVIAAPGIIYPDVGVVPAYPYQQHDPAWKLCQGEHRDRGHGTYDCGPYSYHPYGTYGYRPNGTYHAYRSTPAYVIAPDAKIISIESGD